MKTVIRTLSAFLVLGLLATPVTAQDVAPDADAGTEGLVHICLRISTTSAIDGLDLAVIGQLLLDGGATAELPDPEGCEPEPAGTEEQRPSKSTPYVEFVARGAGAAIELVALAEQNDNAQDLDNLDRAAKSLSTWAKSQRKWLDRHPPQDCYAGVHAQWRRGVVDVRQGAKAVRKSSRTLDAEPMRRAVRRLSRGARACERRPGPGQQRLRSRSPDLAVSPMRTRRLEHGMGCREAHDAMPPGQVAACVIVVAPSAPAGGDKNWRPAARA